MSLYEASFDERWIDEATRLTELVLTHFRDTKGGGFFYTADDHEQLIARNKDLQDSSVPSGNSMAATALVRLGKLCGRQDYIQAASETLELAAGFMEQAPSATGQMLIALDMLLGPMSEIVILGDPSESDTTAVLSELRRKYLPNCVVACRTESGAGGRYPTAGPAVRRTRTPDASADDLHLPEFHLPRTGARPPAEPRGDSGSVRA